MPASLPQSYLRVAHRSLAAADAAIAHNIQEKAGFLAYHAFESTGGALCSSRGVTYHPASHLKKMHRFVATAGPERFGAAVAQVAAEVASLRNALLYPRVLQNGYIGMPEDVLTNTQATRLVGRVRALEARVGVTV